MRLTSAGEKFFQFSETILKKYDSLTEELNEVKDRQIGHLRIAAPFTTLYQLIPSVLKNYIKQFQNVELTILDRSQQGVLDLVRNGDIDFGFVAESNVPMDLKSIRWKKVRTVVLTPIDHPLSKPKRVTLIRLAKYPLILPPKSLKYTYRSNLEEIFQKLGIDYKIIMESSNVELSSIYVEMGFGISFATMVTDLPELRKRKLEFLPMDHFFKPDYIALVLRKDKTLISYKRALIKILFEETSF